MQLVKQTKTQVMAYVKEHGTWHGVVCPCKMYPIIGKTAGYLDLIWSDDSVFVEYNERRQEFDTWYNAWAFYNTNSEEGNYAHYYRIVK